MNAAKKITKAAAHALIPGFLFEKLQAIRWRRALVRHMEKEGLVDATKRYIERNGCIVKHGPFAGTIYPLDAALSRISIPSLLGTYEHELHGILRTVIQRKYDLVIDIGSAEGYYTIGLARALQIKVLAYDPEPIERKFCQQAAKLNNVESLVELRDLFYASDIKKFRDLRVLCICDCEGFETEIFNATSIQDVGRWDLLIELHGDAVQRLTNLGWPQRVSEITSAPPTKSYVELEGLGDQRKLLSENRSGPQTWLWCDSQPEAIFAQRHGNPPDLQH